jgi:hypothetical protein
MLWLLSPKERQQRENALRLQTVLQTVHGLTTQSQYCQALDTLATLPRSDDVSLAQEAAAQQSHLLLGCQIQRELPTVDELGASSDIPRLQTAQRLVQHLLAKAEPYPPLYRALLEKQQQTEQRIAAKQQAQLHMTFWHHLQHRQWREAETLLQQLQGARRDRYAGLLERSQRHSTFLEEGMLAHQELRYEDTIKLLQQIMQEGESPFVEAAATALTHMQAKLAEEQKAFHTHQFPYKRTRTDANFRAGPAASFASHFAIPSGTTVALLNEVQRPGESKPWARVRLTVPKAGHEQQLVGFIRSDLLIGYR